jgi:hypothetical protein
MPLSAACTEESPPPLSALAMEEPLPPIAAAAMEEPPSPLSTTEEGVEHEDNEIVGYVEDAIGHDDVEIVILVAVGDNGGITGGAARLVEGGWRTCCCTCQTFSAETKGASQYRSGAGRSPMRRNELGAWEPSVGRLNELGAGADNESFLFHHRWMTRWQGRTTLSSQHFFQLLKIL